MTSSKGKNGNSEKFNDGWKGAVKKEALQTEPVGDRFYLNSPESFVIVGIVLSFVLRFGNTL